jgi:hypothetical protein
MTLFICAACRHTIDVQEGPTEPCPECDAGTWVQDLDHPVLDHLPATDA